MANNDGKFDPYSAPTIMDVHPVGAGDALPAYEPPKAKAHVPSEPKGIGQLLSEAFALYKNNLVLFVLTAAIALGPVYLVSDALVWLVTPSTVTMTETSKAAAQLESLGKEMQEAQERGASPEEIQAIAVRQMEAAGAAMEEGMKEGAGMLARLGLLLLGLLLTIPLYVLGSYLAQAALTVIIADRARDGSLSAGGAWGVVAGRLPSLIGASFLSTLLIAVGFLLCFVGAPIALLFTSLTIPAALLEKKGAVDAVKRSIELVKSDWVRVVVVIVAFAVLTWVASIVGGIFSAITPFLGTLVGHLVSIAVLPIPIIGLVLLYQDIQRSRLHLTEKELDAQWSELLGPAL